MRRGGFYISDGFALPLWISVATGGKFIKIFTYVDVRDGVSEGAVLKLVNELNAYYFPNSISYRWGKLWSYFYIPVEILQVDAVIVETTFICASSFLAGVRDLDKHNIVL